MRAAGMMRDGRCGTRLASRTNGTANGMALERPAGEKTTASAIANTTASAAVEATSYEATSDENLANRRRGEDPALARRTDDVIDASATRHPKRDRAATTTRTDCGLLRLLAAQLLRRLLRHRLADHLLPAVGGTRAGDGATDGGSVESGIECAEITIASGDEAMARMDRIGWGEKVNERDDEDITLHYTGSYGMDGRR